MLLIALWSPKGGSGTSVVAAACAVTLLHTHHDVRIADFAGDQPALLGISDDRETPFGLSDWLLAGPQSPASALARLAINVPPGLTLVADGTRHDRDATPEAGAALGVLLRDDATITVADLGLADTDARRAVAEVADYSIVVVRGCYLALRRLVHHPLAMSVDGVVYVNDGGRAIEPNHAAAVIDRRLLATFTTRPSIARRIDAGLLATHPPDQLVGAARQLLGRLGVVRRQGRVA